MSEKRKATSELNTTQPPVKRIRPSTSSMTTYPQRTPVADLVARNRPLNLFLNAIDPITSDEENISFVLNCLLQTVYEDPTWKGALDEKYILRKNCLDAIKANSELAEECRKSMKSKDWKPVLERFGRPRTPQDGVGLTSAKFAWEVNFIGEAHYQLLSEMQNAAKLQLPYCTIIPIVQSSGMGKSRTVDQLAKLIFTIPICLRNPDETGYPHGDSSLWNFFTNKISVEDAPRMCIDLLRSIMREISKNLKSQPIDEKTFALSWYERLKPPNGVPSPVRTQLYTDACNNFDHSENVTSAQTSLISEFHALASRIPSKNKAFHPRAIIYIDECHYLSLIDITGSGKKRSLLDAMLHAIELCRPDGLFGITLSTNSSFRSLSPRANEFKSDRERVDSRTLNARPVPFTSLPFDRWNGNPIVVESESTLDEVCTLEFSARFGRPLWWTRLRNPGTKQAILKELVEFAAQKLTLNAGGKSLTDEAKFAALSARLSLRLNTSLESVRNLQDKLVESHMSVAYHVPDHKDYMYSGHPSEPILMEGAAHVWNGKSYPDFNPLETLRKIFTDGFLAKGERGELVGRYICLRAQDICVAQDGSDLIGKEGRYGKAVPLLSYFKAMFGPQWENIRSSQARNRVRGRTLETVCEGKYVRFTHFAKAGDASAVSTAAGWKALARGNGWQFFDRQEGVDLGIPVFDGKPDDCLSRENVTWILIQIKNSSRLQAVHFSAESLGVFDDRKKKNQTPYFVLVFQFSVKAPSKTAATTTDTNSSKSNVPTNKKNPPATPSKVSARRNQQMKPRGGVYPEDERDPARTAHPCYWVDVIGCSSKVFNSEIVPEGNDIFKQLLASRDLLDEAREEKKTAILQLKPFFEAGPASYDWAEDNETGLTPGTMGYNNYEAETVSTVQGVEGEAYSDGED